MGAIKGSPCKIEKIEKKDGQNIITFLWTDNEDVDHRTEMRVDDGTPIYIWISGNHYKYGDLVIYESCFYRCIQENADKVFDNTKWNEIGSPDGNYDIIQNSSALPPRFTSADRKMYYSIEDGAFWLWDGERWVMQTQGVEKQINDYVDTHLATDSDIDNLFPEE